MAEENGSEWAGMSDEQKKSDVDKGVQEARENYAEAEGYVQEKDETTEQPVADEETPVADDAAPEEEEGEGEAVETAEWLDDDTREFASTMGLTDEELVEFGSRAELDRALRIIDRRAFEAGKAAQQPTPPPVMEKQAPVPPPAKPGDTFADLTQFKLGDEWDEAAAAPINKFVEATTTAMKNMQDRLAQFEQRDQASALENLRQKAVTSLHSLGNTELFGKPDEKPTREQIANIEKAIDAHFTHARGLISAGRQAAPTPAFLKAAVNLAFGDQLSQQQQRKLTEKLRKQSARRTGGSTSKIVSKQRSDQSKLDEVLSDPEIDSRFKSLVAERNG